MIIFRNLIPKREGADMEWVLSNPACIICEVRANQLNKRRLKPKCNLHGDSDAVVGVEFQGKRLAYPIIDICCDSFRQDLEQDLLKIANER
jgi:hypothetical protein